MSASDSNLDWDNLRQHHPGTFCRYNHVFLNNSKPDLPIPALIDNSLEFQRKFEFMQPNPQPRTVMTREQEDAIREQIYGPKVQISKEEEKEKANLMLMELIQTDDEGTTLYDPITRKPLTRVISFNNALNSEKYGPLLLYFKKKFLNNKELTESEKIALNLTLTTMATNLDISGKAGLSESIENVSTQTEELNKLIEELVELTKTSLYKTLEIPIPVAPMPVGGFYGPALSAAIAAAAPAPAPVVAPVVGAAAPAPARVVIPRLPDIEVAPGKKISGERVIMYNKIISNQAINVESKILYKNIPTFNELKVNDENDWADVLRLADIDAKSPMDDQKVKTDFENAGINFVDLSRIWRIRFIKHFKVPSRKDQINNLAEKIGANPELEIKDSNEIAAIYRYVADTIDIDHADDFLAEIDAGGVKYKDIAPHLGLDVNDLIGNVITTISPTRPKKTARRRP